MSPVIKTSRHSLVAPPFVSRLFISFLYVYTIVYFGWSHFPFGCVGLAGASQRDHFDTIRWLVMGYGMQTNIYEPVVRHNNMSDFSDRCPENLVIVGDIHLYHNR